MPTTGDTVGEISCETYVQLKKTTNKRSLFLALQIHFPPFLEASLWNFWKQNVFRNDQIYFATKKKINKK